MLHSFCVSVLPPLLLLLPKYYPNSHQEEAKPCLYKDGRFHKGTQCRTRYCKSVMRKWSAAGWPQASPFPSACLIMGTASTVQVLQVQNFIKRSTKPRLRDLCGLYSLKYTCFYYFHMCPVICEEPSSLPQVYDLHMRHGHECLQVKTLQSVPRHTQLLHRRKVIKSLGNGHQVVERKAKAR